MNSTYLDRVGRLLTAILFLLSTWASAQDQTLVLDTGMFNGGETIWLADTGNWVFKKGNEGAWEDPALSTADWDTLRPNQIKTEMADEKGRLEGWFRIRLKLDSSFTGMEVGMIQRVWAATDVFVDGELVKSFGTTGMYGGDYASYDRDVRNPTPLPLIPGKEHVIAIHFVDEVWPLSGTLKSEVKVLRGFFNLSGPNFTMNYLSNKEAGTFWFNILIGIELVLILLSWLIFFFNRKELHLLLIAISISLSALSLVPAVAENSGISFERQQLYDLLRTYTLVGVLVMYPITIGQILKNHINKLHLLIVGLLFILINLDIHKWFSTLESFYVSVGLGVISVGFTVYYIISSWKGLKGAKWAIVVGMMFPLVMTFLLVAISMLANYSPGGEIFTISLFVVFPLSLLIYVFLWFRQMTEDIKTKSMNLLRLSEEKKEILAGQKETLALEVKERTQELKQSLDHLKSTQSQLIHSEKMASLGELTAGIAHEIQNPLNFVNNFAEVNKELIEEVKGERKKEKGRRDEKLEEEILNDIQANEEKISHHGKRAEQIVKSMLQHSRSGASEKELTDINSLCDEYLRLAYHGFRAKDKSFNADFKADLDPNLPQIEVVPQDIGRVLLNIINNAFQAVSAVATEQSEEAKADIVNPQVKLITNTLNNSITITISDNGPGIPPDIKDKIFQPFFTTKPTGEGTGLGLSLSYDIVTRGHGGSIELESEKGKGTQFIITLPFV